MSQKFVVQNFPSIKCKPHWPAGKSFNKLFACLQHASMWSTVHILCTAW